MKRPQLVPAGSVDRLMQAAEQAWRQGQLQESIATLQRAQKLAPGNLQILLQLGRLHGFAYEYPEAERCYEQALKISPNKTETLARAGKQSLDFADPSIARQYLERAVARTDATAEPCVLLAGLYERLHLGDEASALVDKARAIEPQNPDAILARARLDRQAGQSAKAEELLKSILQTSARETRIRACNELGALLDREGRYDEAMSVFLEGKSLQLAEARPLQEQLKRDRLAHEKTFQSLTGDLIQRWYREGADQNGPCRYALLCGHPRSGTTLLEQVLDAHPGVVSLEETPLFRTRAYVPLRTASPPDATMLNVLMSATPDSLREARSRYLDAAAKFLGKPIGERLLLDKNPALNFLIPAFVRILPNAKFLVALRDPRDVCLSCFMQVFVPLGIRNSAYVRLEDTIDEYCAVMSLWLRIKPLLEGHYLEVRYEEMVENLENSARQALKTLGLPWEERVMDFRRGLKGKIVRSPTFADVAKPVSNRAVGRWRKYEKYLQPHLDRLRPLIKALGYED